ncbi:MAG TPA: DUF3017 domain-containing protein [Mycobacterium sp.]|nr:MAG: DUF3017 domain-containing protein [Mycobacterium sp.]HOB49306.1 DUF3017 domain-containing protein [Mycobacterium sp.]HPZ93443.1 DUF3017 domain-containing protein [Mycobacterium sp.]HQE15009.1 DUF3017 domain-containing protein [Mycobacterium sp.]
MKQYWRAVLRRQWPVLTVAAIGLIAAVLVAAGFWRRGALMIGIGVGVAAAFRLLLPADRAGVMVVRSRMVDVSMMTVVCAVMVYIAWTIDPLGTS